MNEVNLISIILPVHNQADHIAAIVQSYQSALSAHSRPYELILVANACRDNSAQICRDLAQQAPRLRFIVSAAGGWGLAVRLGLAAAQGDLLIYTNSARTSAEELLTVLEEALANPRAIIKASRHGRGGLRQLGSNLYNLECRLLFGFSWKDVNGTPKAFPRSFDKLLKLKRDDDLIDAEFCMICQEQGYPLIEIPIRWHTRHGGHSTTRLNSAVKMHWGAIELWRSRHRPNSFA